MNKELTPLEAFERIKNTPTYDNGLVKNFHPSCCEIIETALKRLENYEKNEDFYKDVISYSCLNEKEKIKKLKAFEIIKEKKLM